MGKAILIMEMPESCTECPVVEYYEFCEGYYCNALPDDESDCPDKGRREDCPLKLVEEGEKV